MLAAAAAALSCLAACAGRAAPLRLGAAPELAWPAPPEAARVKLIGSLPSPGSRVELGRPVAVAAGPDGRVLVVDGASAAVHVFDFDDGEHRELRAHGDRQFVSPLGLDLDADGRLYVADADAGIVAVFGPEERFERRIEGLRRPTGVAVDRVRGVLYCVETAAHTVRRMDLGGRELGRLGGPGEGPGELNYPTYVAVDRQGRLLVSDSLNARVVVFEPDGRFGGTISQRGGSSGDLARPKGIATDSEGHVYVADALFNNVQVFDRGGDLLLHFGDEGTAPGQFWLPGGLYIDRRDRLFVANTFAGRVDVFQYLAGSAGGAR